MTSKLIANEIIMSCVIRVMEQLVQGSAQKKAADLQCARRSLLSGGRGRVPPPREVTGEGEAWKVRVGGRGCVSSWADESEDLISLWHLLF